MTTSGPSPARGRQSSEVLDAILDAVAESPQDEAAQGADAMRARALPHVDIAGKVDTLLPITTPKLWVAIAGAVVLLIAGAVYAAGTPRVSSVSASGRVVPAPGVVSVESVTGMGVERLVAAEGADVRSGELLVVGTSAAGDPVELRSPTDGTVWQVLASPGRALAAGEAALTILPEGSATTVLVPLDPSAAEGVEAGQSATASVGGVESPATVAAVSRAPLPGARAAELTGLALDPATTYLMVSLSSVNALPAGAEVAVRIVESESTLLRELVSVG